MPNQAGIDELRALLARIRSSPNDDLNQIALKIIAAQDEVRARFEPVFAPRNICRIDASDFRGFLIFKNNKHWSDLQRQGSRMAADMTRLRAALAILVSEDLPIDSRLDLLWPVTGPKLVRGLGRAVTTAILQVVYPAKYGVVNATTQAGMQRLDLWPSIPRGASFGTWYTRINSVLLELGERLGIDLWTLDVLWWRLTGKGLPRF